jgi:putative transposase
MGACRRFIHAATEALCLPIRLIGSPEQRNDIAFAHDLIDGFEAVAALADKGYDGDHLCDRITQPRVCLVIPPRRNRKIQRTYDADLYKERNRIERFFNKVKQFRRVATRYDKLLANFMGFVKLAAIAIWLKQLNRHHVPRPNVSLKIEKGICLSFSTVVAHPEQQGRGSRSHQGVRLNDVCRRPEAGVRPALDTNAPSLDHPALEDDHGHG